jgi:hypothetical protein
VIQQQEEETMPVVNVEPPLDSGDDPCCVNAQNKWIEGLEEIFGFDTHRPYMYDPDNEATWPTPQGRNVDNLFGDEPGTHKSCQCDICMGTSGHWEAMGGEPQGEETGMGDDEFCFYSALYTHGDGWEGGYDYGEMGDSNMDILMRYEAMECEELIEVLRDFAGQMPGKFYQTNVTGRDTPTQEHYLARKIVEEYDQCVAEMTMGSANEVDMWKSDRCWMCQKVFETHGIFPNLPWYPPNWKQPCPCSEDF